MLSKTDNRAAGLVGAAIVGALVAGALTISSLTAGTGALGDASALRAADLTVAAQDVAMVTIGQAVLLAEDATVAAATEEDVALATGTATTAIATVANRFSELPESARDTLAPTLATWEAAATAVVAAAADGDAGAASDALTGNLAPAAQSLSTEVLALRDRWAAAVADSAGGLGFMTRVAGFFFVFLLPLAAILIYRISVHRQLAEMSALLDTRLAAEADSGSSQTEHWTGAVQDLQAPLRTLVAEARQLASRPGYRDPEEAAQLDSVNRSASELSGRVEDLLVAAGGDSPVPVVATTVEISEVLDDTIAEMTERGHRVGGGYGPGLVLADRERVEQIVRNLISNATEHGGPTVSVFGDLAGNYYVVAVEDNGSGLPERVAEAFESGSVKDGVGLGLTVSRKLATALGGSLDYERVTGRTSFILSLPVIHVDEQQDARLLVAAEG